MTCTYWMCYRISRLDRYGHNCSRHRWTQDAARVLWNFFWHVGVQLCSQLGQNSNLELYLQEKETCGEQREVWHCKISITWKVLLIQHTKHIYTDMQIYLWCIMSILGSSSGTWKPAVAGTPQPQLSLNSLRTWAFPQTPRWSYYWVQISWSITGFQLK